MTRILVTGSTGNAGSELVRVLVDRGFRVRAATRYPERAKTKLGGLAEIAYFDWDKTREYRPVLAGIDGAFLIAPSGGQDVGQRMTPFLKGILEERGIKIVLMTALGVDTVPDHPLLAVEKLITSQNPETTILRPNWFMQNFISFYREMLVDDGVLRLPAGDSKVSFVDTRDIAECAEACFTEERSGRTYTLTGPEAISHEEVVERIGASIGSVVRYVPLTDAQAIDEMLSSGYERSSADYMLKLFQQMRKGYAESVMPDVRVILGKEPRSFRAFCFDHSGMWLRR